MIDHIHAYRAKVKEELARLYNPAGAELFLNMHNPALRCKPNDLLKTKQGAKDLWLYLKGRTK